MTGPLQLILNEIRSLDERGSAPTFWLRDDDAVTPSPALDRFLALSRQFSVPAAVAIIPAETGEPLAARLRDAPLAIPVMHGWSHHNHAPRNEKKQELGPHRPAEAVFHDLSKGYSTLRDLYGERFVPILVPPWNRIGSEILCGLRDRGFVAVSCFGGSPPAASVTVINTHLDPIDWRGGRTCLPHDQLLQQFLVLLRHLGAARRPIGLLTHHLVHDERTWAFLEVLFTATTGRWKDVRNLIASAKAPQAAAPSLNRVC